MIGPTNAKNQLTLTLGGGPVPDTHFASLIHFPRHCNRGQFSRFISIFSQIYNRRLLLMKVSGMTDADKGMSPVHFYSNPADTRTRINWEI